MVEQAVGWLMSVHQLLKDPKVFCTLGTPKVMWVLLAIRRDLALPWIILSGLIQSAEVAPLLPLLVAIPFNHCYQ